MGRPLKTIPFDEDDRLVIAPLIEKIKAGREAEKILADYIGSIVRRSGVENIQRVIMKDLSRLIVLPEEEDACQN